MKEQSLQSIDEQEETKQTSTEQQEAFVSDAEAEWFDNDDSVVEVTVDVSTISEDNGIAAESRNVEEESSDEEDEEESPQPSLAAQEVKLAVEHVDETAGDISMNEDDGSHIPIQAALVDESETE